MSLGDFQMQQTALAVAERITRPRGLITQIDASLVIPGATIGTSLSIYGQWQRGFPGDQETPKEPAGWDITRVEFGNTDITSELSGDDLEKIEQYLKENV